jgi:hypothetical protein
MFDKLFTIKINNNSTTNEQLFNDFEECFDYEHQRIEQERLLQQELNHQRSIVKPQLKKIIDEDVSYTNDIRDVLPNYYDKSFKPVKKYNNKNFIFFKYSTNNDNEKEDLQSEEQSSSSSSEELESKNLLLKEIELLFEKCYFYSDIEKMFPKFYKDNKSKINFLYTQVLDERFKKDPTLEVQKDIYVYRSKKEQIKIIEKRKLLQKAPRKHKKKHVFRIDYDDDSDIRIYKRFKAKKEFESALNDEIMKVEEASEAEKSLKEMIVMILKI